MTEVYALWVPLFVNVIFYFYLGRINTVLHFIFLLLPAFLTCLFPFLFLFFPTFFSSVGVVASQLWWQEHPGRCCRQVLHWSSTYPVVGMDTSTSDLPGWLRRQTSAQPNQPGETFSSVKEPIIAQFLFLNHLVMFVTFHFVFFGFHEWTSAPPINHS